jgi:hypothetical protein
MHGDQVISVPKKEVDLAPIREDLEK